MKKSFACSDFNQSTESLPNRRLLGAFYTPDNVATLLTQWALKSGFGTVLDPSFGGCSFIRAAVNLLSNYSEKAASELVYGVDIDPNCLHYVEGLLPESNYMTANFLALSPESMPGAPFKVIVGNPPYIRHHWLKEANREAALSAARRARIPLRRTASMWAYFVVHVVGFLASGGRLAMLVPEAILQADYAKAVREFLRQRFANVVLVRVRDRMFVGTDEPVVVVLGDGVGPGSLRIEAIDSVDELAGFLDGNGREAAPQRAVISNGRVVSSDVVHVLNDIQNLDEVVSLGEIADVRIGFVTGANEYFIRNRKDISRLRIPSNALLPVVAKTKWLKGIDFTKEDHRKIVEEGGRAFLIRPLASLQDHPAIKAWTEEGTKIGVDNRYKCRIRNPWFQVQAESKPDAFATCSRFGSPLLVLNRCGYRCSNAIHSVSWRNPKKYYPAAIAVGYLTSLASVLAEIRGRRYGGGVLKLEPGALRNLQIPVVKSAAEYFSEVDELMRCGKEEAARRLADKVVLKQGLCLSQKEVSLLIRARHDLIRQRVPIRNGGQIA